MTLTRLPRTPPPVSPLTAAVGIGVTTAALWVIELVDQLLRGRLDVYGIHSWEVGSLPSIFVAPWLHAGWQHLASNTVPLLVLGFLVVLGGVGRTLTASLMIVTVSGLFAWLLSPPHTVTVGASGLIFGWLTYLLARGFFTRNVKQILIAVVVFLLYGGVLWGVLPNQVGVSWQAHLGGALGGLLAAAWLHRRRSVPSP